MDTRLCQLVQEGGTATHKKTPPAMVAQTVLHNSLSRLFASVTAVPLPALPGTLSPFTADFAHVFAVLANDLPAFAAGFSRLIPIPLMSHALPVSSPAALAGNSFLLFAVHGCEATVRCFAAAGFAPFKTFASWNDDQGVPVPFCPGFQIDLFLP
jgi:hypothetical protein